jgi:MFS transporter, DHA2 family, multidrug resistance protein
MASAPSITHSGSEPAKSHKWLVALAVMLGCSMEVLDVTIINVALPHMQGSFSASVDEIAWVVTSYLVSNGVMIPMTGWISARFGRKRYFLTSVALFVAASTMCGAARSLDQMVLFRLLQGAAGAAMIPSSQAIMMETFPPEEQQMAMALWGMGLMVAPIMGPTLGGWITDNWSWRWTFYINVPVGFLAFLMVSTFVHDPSFMRGHRAQTARVDYLGIILLIVGLGTMQILLDRGQRADWFASIWVRYATVIAVTSIVGLVIHELTFSDPILDLRIFRYPLFDAAVFLVIAHSFLLYGTGLLTPIFLQDLMGYTAWKAGVVMIPRGLGSMFSMLIVGQVARAGYNNRRMIGFAYVLMTIGLWQMAHWTLGVSIWQVIVAGLFIGSGLGIVFPILSAAALSCVARERMGFAASLYNMMRNNAAAVGIAYLTNKLVSLEQVHQAYLVGHFSVFDAWRLSKVAPMEPGSTAFNYLPQLITGQKQGLGMVYGMIQAQAAMLSFNDIYLMGAVLTFCLIPSFLLLGSRRVASAGSGAGRDNSLAAH